MRLRSHRLNLSPWLSSCQISFGLLIFVLSCTACSSKHFNKHASAENRSGPRVLMIGVDGMSQLGIDRAKTPTLDKLRKQGAFTGVAQAVLPTKSSPNWMSMLTGATVEQHGVTSNSWQPHKQSISPVCVSGNGLFLDVFSQLRAERPKIHLSCFYDWADFGRLFDWSPLNTVQHYDNATKNAHRASRYFCKEKPDFQFVHLDHVDHKLHAMGFDSKAYAKGIEKADRLIGQMISNIEAAGMMDETILIISADHGGKGRNHGGDSPAEVQIPIYIAGPGIPAGVTLSDEIMIYDIPATILDLLGVTIPDCWTGERFLPKAK